MCLRQAVSPLGIDIKRFQTWRRRELNAKIKTKPSTLDTSLIFFGLVCTSS